VSSGKEREEGAEREKERTRTFISDGRRVLRRLEWVFVPWPRYPKTANYACLYMCIVYVYTSHSCHETIQIPTGDANHSNLMFPSYRTTTQTYKCTYTYTVTCTYNCTYTCAYTHMCTYTYTYTYTYTCTYTYKYTYTYTYT